MTVINRLLTVLVAVSAACWAQSTVSANLPHVDCVFTPSQNCPTLTVQGDPYSTTGGFTGYADPTIRQDPNNNGMIWMAYSWPTVLPDKTKPIDIHLAYNNNGAGWTNSGLTNYVLYQHQQVTNPVTEAPDDETSHEVISLAMQNVSGTTYVYQVHLVYLVPSGQVGPLAQPYTARLMISGCAITDMNQGPDCLLNATPQYVGGSGVNTTYWPIIQDLSALSGTACTRFGEPTILVTGNQLLLNVNCVDDYSQYFQFSTPNPSQNLGNWSWNYTGTFGSKTDANALCSYFNACGESLFFNACELAASAYVGYLAVCNIDTSGSGGLNNVLGSAAVAFSNISPPTFSQVSGAPQVLAYMTCSQCTAHGPGAPAFEPAYLGGIVSALVLTSCAGGSPGCVATSGFNGEFTQLATTGLPGDTPMINTGGVVNAASFQPTVAPGSIATVFGEFLPNATAFPSGFPLPGMLSGFSMQFGGQYAAPLDFVGGGQVNVQIPWELAGQTSTTLTATYNGQASGAGTVNLAPFAPGIFSTNSEGTGQGLIVDLTYTLVDSSNPAPAGSTVIIYATGLGPVSNQPESGVAAPSSPPAESANTPTVTIGGVTAGVQFSGLAPGWVGLYQINVTVPSGVAAGSDVPVIISVNGAGSNTVTMAVQ